MTGLLVAVALAVAAQSPGAIQAPVQSGAATEVCGRVTGFEAGQPSGCDAVLTVTTADGTPMKVVLPKDVRWPMSGGRDLEGSSACFTGALETVGSTTMVRVPAIENIRITQTARLSEGASARRPQFGTGVPDVCMVEGVSSPKLLQEVKPQYTSETMRERIEGVVGLEAVIDLNGSVRDVRVVRPLHPHLDENAMNAMRAWHFAPAERNGKPIMVIVNVEMTYTIKSKR